MKQYEILKLGINLVEGGWAIVGDVYDRSALKMSEFTLAKRISGGWIKEVEPIPEEPEPEPEEASDPEPEPEETEEEPIVEEDPPTEPTRNDLMIQQYWDAAEVPEGYKKKRICPECGDICSGKSELFGHCEEAETD